MPGNQRGVARVLLLAAIAVFAGVGFVAWEGYRRLNADGPLKEDAIVWIKRGDSMTSIARGLEDDGLIAEGGARLFYYYGRASGLSGALRAGEFTVPPGASMVELAEILRTADPLLRFVTIPEGRTVAQAVAILEQAPMLEGEVTLTPDEGDLLPETYAYERGETRDSVLERMIRAHDALLADLWPRRADNLPIETQEEAIILASIVEKETAVPEERPRVASVFVNRLRRGMRLQSDPTIIYGLTGGEPLGRGLRVSELNDTDNPYNTYRIDGLPPTPIANPGRESISAVLNPAETDDLYFVADGNGGHVFASSLREHNKNVQRWRQIERARAEQ